MFDIGTSLAAARKGQGLAPADAERLTCLRGKYLAALETDDFDALPGRTYARAFLRTYADALGLDANLFVNEFDARFPEEEEEEDVAPAQLVRVRRGRKVPPRFLAVVAALAAIGGFVVWINWSPQNTFSPASPPPAANAAAPPAHKVLAAHHTVVAPAKSFPLVIRATTGACWLLVRRGSANGPVIFQGMLEPGKSLSFGPRVWVRLGAPWNVAVHRGPHAFTGLPASTPVNLTA